MGGVSMRTPKTMTGKQLVERTLNAMALPPDEWANEFKDLTGQLVEALEQLHARETELAECAGLVAHYEGHLAVMRQQTAMLYADHLHYANEVDEKDTAKKEELEQLLQVRQSSFNTVPTQPRHLTTPSPHHPTTSPRHLTTPPPHHLIPPPHPTTSPHHLTPPPTIGERDSREEAAQHADPRRCR